MTRFRIPFSDKEASQLLRGVPSDLGQDRIDVTWLLKMPEPEKNVSPVDSDDDVPVDMNGRIGDVKRCNLDPMTHDEVLAVLSSNEKAFLSALKSIKDIDMDNNGFVTVAELSDIFAQSFPSKFNGKDIFPFIKQYRSI
jgi:hypothetical protein